MISSLMICPFVGQKSLEDRGLRSATPELPTRLLASIALSITPDSVKRLTDTHVEFVTRFGGGVSL